MLWTFERIIFYQIKKEKKNQEQISYNVKKWIKIWRYIIEKLYMINTQIDNHCHSYWFVLHFSIKKCSYYRKKVIAIKYDKIIQFNNNLINQKTLEKKNIKDVINRCDLL